MSFTFVLLGAAFAAGTCTDLPDVDLVADSRLNVILVTPVATDASIISDVSAEVALTMLQDEADTIVAPFGSRDTWWMDVHAGGGSDVKDSGNAVFAAGIGLSYFMYDDVSMTFELNGIHFSQEVEDATGANGNLLVRWHFVHEDQYTIYAEAGAGLLGTTNDVPFDGSSFNFTPMTGIGATYALEPDMHLMLGLRWLHVSNANIYDTNPGRDHWYVYGGLTFPF